MFMIAVHAVKTYLGFYDLTWFNLIAIWSPTVNIQNLHYTQLYITQINLILIPIPAILLCRRDVTHVCFAYAIL